MPDSCVDQREDLVIEKYDKHGRQWVKKYVGGGLHFDNWLAQYKEVYGVSNVAVEEIAAAPSSCYGRGGEKLFRIWVRENSEKTRNSQDV